MTLWIVYYFLGIYLTIMNYLFLPEKYDRESIMQCIHLIFTVPAAYNLSEKLIRYYSFPDLTVIYLLFTLVFTFSSLFLWGIAVKRISALRRKATPVDSGKSTF
jgi:hypothetical protein